MRLPTRYDLAGWLCFLSARILRRYCRTISTLLSRRPVSAYQNRWRRICLPRKYAALTCCRQHDAHELCDCLKALRCPTRLPNRAEILLPAQPPRALSRQSCSWFQIHVRRPCSARDRSFHFRRRSPTIRARSKRFHNARISVCFLVRWQTYVSSFFASVVLDDNSLTPALI